MSYRISRKIINEMVKREQNISSRRSSGGSGAGGGGGVSSAWVDEHYVSKDFFLRLFSIHGHNAEDTSVNPEDIIIEPNDTDEDTTVLDSIEAKAGLWTNSFISAYGLNSSEGGGGGSSTLAGLTDTAISSPSSGQVLVYDGLLHKWVNGAAQSGGGISSISMSVPTGFSVSPSTISNSGGTFAITFASGYALPTTAKQDKWDEAYGWGDHSEAGYLTDQSSTITTMRNDVTTLQGYFTNGVANVADKLNTGNTTYTAWGRTFWTGGKPTSISGKIENASHIEINNNAKIYWKTSPSSATLSEQYISILTLDASNNFVVGESMANSGLSTYIRGRRVVLQSGTGNSGNHRATLDADGVLTVEKLVIGSITIEHDTTNGGLHIINAGVYADTYFSAYGIGSGGGGGSVSLNQPLSGINSAGLGAPSAAGSAIVWNGSSWTYSSNSNLRVASLSSLGSITAYSNVTSQYGGFAVSGKNDNYILTAGGGTKLFKLAIDSTSLEDGQALVYDESTSSWVNGAGGTAYTLPLATSGTRGGVQIGYSESNSGSDSTRNYAVKLSSEKMYVNVPWEGFTAGNYATTSKLFFIGATSCNTTTQNAAAHTYTNQNCYIYLSELYSNESKVITESTETKTTAGNFNISGSPAANVIYLVGTAGYSSTAGSYASTYVNKQCYVGTDNYLYSNGGRAIAPVPVASHNLNFADSIGTGGIYQIHSGLATKDASWPFDYGLVANFVSTNGHLQIAASSAKNDIKIRSYWWTGNSQFGSYPDWQTLIHSGNVSSYIPDTSNFVDITSNQNVGGIKNFTTKVGMGTADPKKRLHVIGGIRADRPNSDSEGGGFQSVYGSKIASFGCNPSGGLVLANGTVDSNGDPTFTTCAIFSASDVTDPYMSVKPNTRFYQTSGTSNIYLGRSDNAGWVCMQDCASAANTSNWALRTNGDARFLWVGINGNNTSYRLYVNGTSYLGGNTLALGSISPVNNISYHLGSSSTRWSTVYCASVNASSDCSISGNVTISGVLGVGGSNGSFKLYVSGSAKVSTYLGVATDPDTSDSTNKLFVGGAVKASAYNYMSDVRKKNIIDYIDKDIAEIANAPIFDYTWKDSEDRSLHVGSSAQYWLNVLPHVVSQSSDGFYFMDYSCTALASVIITARKVQNHEERILELERENEALRKEIETLKAA